MLYSNPKNILQAKLNEVLGIQEETIITELLKLSLLEKASKDKDLLLMTEVYNLLGLDKFTDLIALLDGKDLRLPNKEDFKEANLIILCYYYHVLEKKSWDEIKTILGLPDLNTVRLGIKISQYEKFLKTYIDRRLK